MCIIVSSEVLPFHGLWNSGTQRRIHYPSTNKNRHIFNILYLFLKYTKKKVFNSLTFRVFTKQKTEGGSVDSLGGGDQKPPLQY